VGSDGVVLDPPVLDQHACFEQAAERLDGEQLVAQPPAERLDVRVLPGRARLDVAAPGLVEPAPVAQRVGGQLRAVVATDAPRWPAALGDQAVKHGDGGIRIDAPVDGDRQGLAGVLIHDVEQLEDPAIEGLVELVINLLSGNYEFACLILIDDEEWWRRFGGLIEANWEIERIRLYSSRDTAGLRDLMQDPRWSNEGLFAFSQGLRRLTELDSTQRVAAPRIEVGA
jgi:hypothetical protein